MPDVAVFIDSSASMTVLGKEAIAESIVQTLSLLPQLNELYKDWTFSFQHWNSQEESLEDILALDDLSMIITDGFCEEIPESGNIGVVLVGQDALESEKKNHFQSIAILNAVNFLQSHYE
ncbi:MAG: hypothetical protein ACRC5H_10400 [Treponemataceae bacterium]